MRPGERGTVVVEAMIAALIVAAMAAALFSTIRADAAAARATAERRRALLVAQSVLATAGATGPVAPGAREGVDDGLVWRLAVTPMPTPDGSSSMGTLDRVVVTVRADGGTGVPLVTLPSLRFGR